MAELHELLKQKKQEDYKAWVNQDFTTKLMRHLISELEETKAKWANGNFTHPEQAGTIQLNATALGKVQLLAELIEYIADAEMLSEETE